MRDRRHMSAPRKGDGFCGPACSTPGRSMMHQPRPSDMAGRVDTDRRAPFFRGFRAITFTGAGIQKYDQASIHIEVRVNHERTFI